jgi:hypothetical protein
MPKNVSPTSTANFITFEISVRVHEKQYSWDGAYGTGQMSVTVPIGFFSAPDFNKAYPVMLATAQAEFAACVEKARLEQEQARLNAETEAANHGTLVVEL